MKKCGNATMKVLGTILAGYAIFNGVITGALIDAALKKVKPKGLPISIAEIAKTTVVTTAIVYAMHPVLSLAGMLFAKAHREEEDIQEFDSNGLDKKARATASGIGVDISAVDAATEAAQSATNEEGGSDGEEDN